MCRDTFNITVIAAAAIHRQKIGNRLPRKQRVMPYITVIIDALPSIANKRPQRGEIGFIIAERDNNDKASPFIGTNACVPKG